MSGPWQRLDRELDAWQAAGRVAEIWWRDDDAAASGERLTRLLDLAAAAAAPVSLAVIPAAAGDSLPEALARHPAESRVLQHGFAHRNHAAPDAKKCELVSPAARPQGPGELRAGLERLRGLFGTRLLPVLVPPWNRVAGDLVAQLPALGFAGLSTYKARDGAAPVPGIVQVNCHVDILQWRPARQFLGTAPAIDLLAGHLAAKRQGTADAAEPSGLLSHHLVHDEAAWGFLAQLLARLGAHPAVRLLGAGEVFSGAPAMPDATP